MIVAKPEPKYALKAFRVEAVDFVSKPASGEDVLKATVKAGIEIGRIDRWLPLGALVGMKTLDG